MLSYGSFVSIGISASRVFNEKKIIHFIHRHEACDEDAATFIHKIDNLTNFELPNSIKRGERSLSLNHSINSGFSRADIIAE